MSGLTASCTRRSEVGSIKWLYAELTAPSCNGDTNEEVPIVHHNKNIVRVRVRVIFMDGVNRKGRNLYKIKLCACQFAKKHNGLLLQLTCVKCHSLFLLMHLRAFLICGHAHYICAFGHLPECG
jgi:hypothetical protein